jgi:hypothetical protein
MSEPTAESKPTNPAEQSDGSALWALLVGGAILVVAGLLIFWPGGDAGSGSGRQQGVAGNQASHAVSGDGAGGPGSGMGVRAREIDPAAGRPASRVTPGLLPEGQAGISMAPPRPAKPEPTTFESASAEIEYYEKKLAQARHDFEQRGVFLERAKRSLDNANTPKLQDTAMQRLKVVQNNYDLAKQTMDELETKVVLLKKKQRETGSF